MATTCSTTWPPGWLPWTSASSPPPLLPRFAPPRPPRPAHPNLPGLLFPISICCCQRLITSSSRLPWCVSPHVLPRVHCLVNPVTICTLGHSAGPVRALLAAWGSADPHVRRQLVAVFVFASAHCCQCNPRRRLGFRSSLWPGAGDTEPLLTAGAATKGGVAAGSGRLRGGGRPCGRLCHLPGPPRGSRGAARRRHSPGCRLHGEKRHLRQLRGASPDHQGAHPPPPPPPGVFAHHRCCCCCCCSLVTFTCGGF